MTPLAAPAGSWTNALTITKLPYLSARFNVGAEREDRSRRCKAQGAASRPLCRDRLLVPRWRHQALAFLVCPISPAPTHPLPRLQGPYHKNTAPADCSDLATRVSADRTTRTTGSVRVYRWADGVHRELCISGGQTANYAALIVLP